MWGFFIFATKARRHKGEQILCETSRLSVFVAIKKRNFNHWPAFTYIFLFANKHVRIATFILA